MRYYVAILHRDSQSYGISFPDVPGTITSSEDVEEVLFQAAEVLNFAADKWLEQTGEDFPPPRTIDELSRDEAFIDSSRNALLLLIPLATAMH